MNKKQTGFTLIELMIVIAIIAIIAAIAAPAIFGSASKEKRDVSYGWNGMTETRCINGFRFVVGERGHVTQILDENGHGVRCEVNN